MQFFISCAQKKHKIERVTVSLLGLCVAPEAFAYLDPGTGSMLIQGLIASIAMASITVRMYWHKLRSYFGAAHSDDNVEGSITETESDQ